MTEIKNYNSYVAFVEGGTAHTKGDSWYDCPYRDETPQDTSNRHDWQLGFQREWMRLDQAHVRVS